MRRYIIEVVKSKNKQHYWRLKSSNGKTLAHSETFKQRVSCLRIAKQLRCDLESGHVICKLREV